MSITAVLVGDKEVLARLKSMPDKVREGLINAMTNQWYALQAHIVRDKLNGQVLNRRTGFLASSINVGAPDTLTEFTAGPNEIVGRVGTAVRYAAIHEYGGTVNVKGHTRQQTQVFGRPIDPIEVSVRPHTATFPMRSFLRTGLADRSSQIRDAIQSSVQAAMR